jgi:hypothetical protein
MTFISKETSTSFALSSIYKSSQVAMAVGRGIPEGKCMVFNNLSNRSL